MSVEPAKIACSVDPAKIDWHVSGLRFFTIWNTVLVAAHRITHGHVDLLMTSIITAVAGTSFVYMTPKKIYVPMSNGPDGTLCGWRLRMFDLGFHLMPLAFVAVVYGRSYRARGPGLHTLAALAILSLYLVINSPTDVYGVTLDHIAGTLGVSLAVYSIFMMVAP
jgi:hypothetical protein